jgi:hypothetical protein
MADMGLTVGGGRAVIKGEAFFTFSGFDAFFKDLVFFPEL